MSDDEKIAYEMEVDLPNLPGGELVQIAGLGTFKNGDTYEVTQEEADAYRSYNNRQVPVTDDKTGTIIGSEIEQGPTLLQASKGMYGVTVTVPKSTQLQLPVGDDKEDKDNEGGGS